MLKDYQINYQPLLCHIFDGKHKIEKEKVNILPHEINNIAVYTPYSKSWLLVSRYMNVNHSKY